MVCSAVEEVKNHADIVIPWSSVPTYPDAIVPFPGTKKSIFSDFTFTQQGEVICPLFPFVEISAAVSPLPSFNGQQAKSPWSKGADGAEFETTAAANTLFKPINPAVNRHNVLFFLICSPPYYVFGNRSRRFISHGIARRM
jgi:hypothetical protein